MTNFDPSPRAKKCLKNVWHYLLVWHKINSLRIVFDSLLDVANGANSPKLVECMRRMCDLYDRPCLIIEKDRVRPGETEKKL